MTKKMMLALVAMASVAVLAGCGTYTEETTTEETLTGEVMEVVMTGDEVVETMEEATPATEEAVVEETTVETPADVVVEDVATEEVAAQ